MNENKFKRMMKMASIALETIDYSTKWDLYVKGVSDVLYIQGEYDYMNRFIEEADKLWEIKEETLDY